MMTDIQLNSGIHIKIWAKAKGGLNTTKVVIDRISEGYWKTLKKGENTRGSQRNEEETNTLRRESEESTIAITRTQTAKNTNMDPPPTEQVKKKIKNPRHKR